MQKSMLYGSYFLGKELRIMRKAKRILALMMTIAIAASIPVSAAATDTEEVVIEVGANESVRDGVVAEKDTALNTESENIEIAEEEEPPVGYYDENREFDYFVMPYTEKSRKDPSFIECGGPYAIVSAQATGEDIVYPSTVTCESEKDIVDWYRDDEGKKLIGQEIPVRYITNVGTYFKYGSDKENPRKAKKISKLIIPDGVKQVRGGWADWDDTIASRPDEYKTELKEVYIPDSVEFVDNYFMYWYCSVCPKHEVIIPSSLKTVEGTGAFKTHEYSNSSLLTWAKDIRLKVVNKSKMTFTYEQLYYKMPTQESSEYCIWYDENGNQVDELLPGETIYFGDWTDEGIYLHQTVDEFDRWGFENAEQNYGNPENGYAISTQDYQKLTLNLDSVRKDTVTRELNVNLAGTNKKWFGSCYGMSASTISVNTKDITPAAMGISSETLMDVKTADSSYKKDKKDSIGAVESTINFFHVQQSLPEYQAVRDEFSQLSPAEQISRVANLAKTAKSKPAILDIWWKDGNNIEGHSIVAKGWRKLGNSDSSSLRDKYKYCILTYDCSNPDLTGDTSDCNIYYNDEGQWEVPGWGITPSNAYMICGTNDISTFNPISYTSGEYRKATTPQTSIRAEASEWTVKWGENNRAEIVNGVIVQSTDDSLRILPTLTNTPVSQTEYKVNMPNNKEYSISSDKPLNHSVVTNDSITEIKTEGGASAVINNGDVAVNSNTDGIELRFVMNESPISENEAKIKASNAKELDVTQVENGFVVKGDDLTDVVFAEVKNNVENPKTLQTEDKSILITEKEGEVIAYSDKDGDGIHETEIKVEEKKCTIVLGQKINLRQTCFSDVTDTISRYAVNNTSLAGVSKEMLSGKKTGTVTVYAQKMISKNNYENIAECEVTILSKPKLKFTKNMTYVDQTVNGADFFLTEDIRTYGATYWESNKPGIVEVTDSENGILKAKSSGTAKITAYFGEKGKQGTFKVSANLAVKIPSYVKTEYSLQTGAKLPISMKNVNGALDPEWETSDEGIARASAQRNSKGVKTGKALVEGVACGNTTLIATIDGQKYNCTIYVTPPEINKKAMTLKVGKQGTVSLKKTKIKKADVIWISDNPEVATVDENGKITASKSGNATIYTETGGIRNECHVTVP